MDIASNISGMVEPGCLAVTNTVWSRLCNREGFTGMDTSNKLGGSIKVFTKQLATPPRPCSVSELVKRWNLSYLSDHLELSYAGYFATRSIKLDITLLVIVILSQLSWIHRWEFRGSFLYTAMVGLVSFNFACLALVLNSRHLYLRWR